MKNTFAASLILILSGCGGSDDVECHSVAIELTPGVTSSSTSCNVKEPPRSSTSGTSACTSPSQFNSIICSTSKNALGKL